MDYPEIIPAFFLDFLWIMPGLSLDYLLYQDFPWNIPRIIFGLFFEFPWIVSQLSCIIPKLSWIILWLSLDCLSIILYYPKIIPGLSQDLLWIIH